MGAEEQKYAAECSLNLFGSDLKLKMDMIFKLSVTGKGFSVIT